MAGAKFGSVFVVLAIFICRGQSHRSPADAFPELNGNLTRVTWAHAVNDRTYLQAALASDVMFLEADIVMGHLTGAEDGVPIPIMAHPPSDVSDLSLEQFLTAVSEHNAKVDKPKGVKLDYKSIEGFEASQPLLTHVLNKNVKYPVWLNADILPGPVNASATPVDADRFLALASRHPHMVLSLGWTTAFGPGITEGYQDQHIQDMFDALEKNKIEQSYVRPPNAAVASWGYSTPLMIEQRSSETLGSQFTPNNNEVTFAVRAGLAALSPSNMLRLLSGTKLLTSLTIWSSVEADPVDVAALRTLILDAGLDRVFIDLTDNLQAALNLPS